MSSITWPWKSHTFAIFYRVNTLAVIRCEKEHCKRETTRKWGSTRPSWRPVVTPALWILSLFFERGIRIFFTWPYSKRVFGKVMKRRLKPWGAILNYIWVVDRQRVFNLSSTFHLWSPMPFGNINKFSQHPFSVGIIFLITDYKLGSKHSQGNCPRIYHMSLSE